MDGTNGQILVTKDGDIFIGSRARWLSEKEDNHGFYKWVVERQDYIKDNVPPGRYYGEFVGKGIQRGYGLDIKRFYLFSTYSSFEDGEENGFYQVPVLSMTTNLHEAARDAEYLYAAGSVAVPGFMKPEGVVVRSSLTGQAWKHIINPGSK
jgi:hypothetical protein